MKKHECVGSLRKMKKHEWHLAFLGPKGKGVFLAQERREQEIATHVRDQEG